MYYENSYWGMNIIWWFIWGVLLFWIFVTPYDVPGQRKKKNSPLDILERRFANGEITAEEFAETRRMLQSSTR
jgi:putative membrane protein